MKKFDICIVASRCKKNVYMVTVGDLAFSSWGVPLEVCCIVMYNKRYARSQQSS